jgi:hypothetical protein
MGKSAQTLCGARPHKKECQTILLEQYKMRKQKGNSKSKPRFLRTTDDWGDAAGRSL